MEESCFICNKHAGVIKIVGLTIYEIGGETEVAELCHRIKSYLETHHHE